MILKALLILSILSAISSQKFLFQLATTAPASITAKLMGIARDLGAGCTNNSELLDCVFGTLATLEQAKKKMTDLGVQFEDPEQYGAVNVKYFAYGSENRGYKNISIRFCSTSLYEYYLNKLDDKITLLDDEICRNDPSGCVKTNEKCDAADCLSVPKKVFQSALNIQLLDMDKELYPNAQAKANFEKIVPALKTFKIVLEKDSLASKCPAISIDKCMALVVVKGTDTIPDVIKKITKEQIDGFITGCK